jgi:hypothetical protein
MNNNILITGGLGFIGSYLAKHLTKIGYSVSIIDNEFRWPLKSQNNLTNWVEGASKEQLTEITNSSEFKNAVEKTQNPKNLSVEEIEKQGQKILDMLKMVTEKSKLDLKTKDPENEDFIIDIPDEEFDNTFPEDKQ